MVDLRLRQMVLLMVAGIDWKERRRKERRRKDRRRVVVRSNGSCK
jgi:hypothetical protein